MPASLRLRHRRCHGGTSFDGIEAPGRWALEDTELWNSIPDSFMADCHVHPSRESEPLASSLRPWRRHRWCSPGAALSELIGDGEGGVLYDPEAPNGLKDALRGLLTDSEEARRLGEQGYRRACAHFSAEHAACDMIALYETVLAGPASCP